MKHKDKLTMARKLMTKKEIKAHESPFNSDAWNKRKADIEKRVAKQQAEAHARSVARKEAKKNAKA